MQQRRAWEISQLHFGANLWGEEENQVLRLRRRGPDPELKKRGRRPPNLPCPLMSHRDLTYLPTWSMVTKPYPLMTKVRSHLLTHLTHLSYITF